MLNTEIQARCGSPQGHHGPLSRVFDTSAFHIKSPSGEEIRERSPNKTREKNKLLARSGIFFFFNLVLWIFLIFFFYFFRSTGRRLKKKKILLPLRDKGMLERQGNVGNVWKCLEKRSAGNKALLFQLNRCHGRAELEADVGRKKSGISGWMLQLPIQNLPLPLLLSLPGVLFYFTYFLIFLFLFFIFFNFIF